MLDDEKKRLYIAVMIGKTAARVKERALKPDLASRKAAMPPSLSWKFTEKEFTEQVKDVKLFVKCIQAITLNHSPLLCAFASLREISMSEFRRK